MKLFRVLLFPFALVYGAIVALRNALYNAKVFKSSQFDLPLIGVGNLSMGGTGKTPHIEYLIRLLQDRFKVATLSRGYKRKTVGYYEATTSSTYHDVGDEPLQFKQKFNIPVAVDSIRVRGIIGLIDHHPDLDAILLDDVFQHRAVQPGLMILLTDYKQLYTNDYIVPMGDLREWRVGAKRANIIVVTKTPEQFSEEEQQHITNQLQPLPHQQIFFSYIRYGSLTPLWDKTLAIPTLDDQLSVVLFTGIANASPLVDFLAAKGCKTEHLAFSDHRAFSEQDLVRVRKIFDNFASSNKIIVTTEKDAMRLLPPGKDNPLLNLPVYFIDIEVQFHGNGAVFEQQIVDYVRENKGDD